MIEQLSGAGFQKLSAEMASERLESLLRIGQTLTARVLESTPQPPRKSVAQPQTTTSQVRQTTGSEAGAQQKSATAPQQTAATTQSTSSAGIRISTDRGTQSGRSVAGNTGPGAGSAGSGTASAAASTTTSGTAPATDRTGSTVSVRPTATTTPRDPVTASRPDQPRPVPVPPSAPRTPESIRTGQQAAADSSYRARLNVEGRIIEVVTPRPLTPGTEIRITRENAGQISLSLPTRSDQAPSQAATRSDQSAAAGKAPGATTPATPEQLVRPGERALARVVQVVAEAASRPAPPPPSASAGQNPPTAAAASQPATATQSTATATSGNQGTPPTTGFRITLDLQGRQVEVLAQRPVSVGTEVRVRQDGSGQVTVEVPAAKTQAVENALRQHLPLQQPPTQLLNLLGDPQNANQLARAQPLLQSLVQILLGRSIAAPQQTSADGVRQQLLNSGTLLENRLARGDSTALNQDHKALLIRLEQRLASADPKAMPQPLGQRITQMTQQAISRVLFNQVSSLTQQSQEGAEATRQLVMDIPVLWQGRNENIQLRINGEESSHQGDTANESKRWQVTLQFDMEDLPAMGARLTLEGESVSVVWFGDQQIRRLLEPNLKQLQTLLENIGLEVSTLAVREQAPPQSNIRPPRQQLIDIKS